MKAQSLKTLAELPGRLVRFAELYAQGMSAAKAARECGYSKNVANGSAYAWIGKTRESSQYPYLWDYYAQIRREKLRLFEVDADSIKNELKLIAFSKIDNYLDLPSKEVHNAITKLEEQIRKACVELDTKFINPEFKRREEAGEPTNGIKRIIATPAYYRLEDKIRKLETKLKQKRTGPGAYLRLKFVEDIPAELLPAIAEIRETKEGIAVKLHSKIDALDMLAKISKLYAAEADGGDGTGLATVKEVNLVVNGSKSALMVASSSSSQADQSAA
jgi:hypothetical protein